MPRHDVLVVVALADESAGLLEQAGAAVLYTGVGKVNATYALTRRLVEYRAQGRTMPRVLNLGTAGSRVYPTGSLVACHRFIQRDMDATALGFAPGATPFDPTPAELIEIHEHWFKDPNWIWEGSVAHQVVGEDMAMALIRYQYRAKADDEPFSTWLVYVFRLEDGEWRIVHDQNTALDYGAFARSAGLDIG